MSTTTADTTTDTTSGCPSWCQHHSTDDDGRQVTHVRPITVGAVSLEVEQYVTPRDDEPTGPVVVLPQVQDWIMANPRDVLDYIAALQQAGDILEGVGPDELFCERCAPGAEESFQTGMRAGMRIAAGRVFAGESAADVLKDVS